MTTQPYCDNSYKKSFIEITASCLTVCKRVGQDHLEFTPSQKQVIEYFFKDISREPVSEETSTEECAEMYLSWVNKLVRGDEEEWKNFNEIIFSHLLLSEEELVEIYELESYFKL